MHPLNSMDKPRKVREKICNCINVKPRAYARSQNYKVATSFFCYFLFLFLFLP